MVERKTVLSALLVALSLSSPYAFAQTTAVAPLQDAARNGEDRVVFDLASKSLVVYGLHNSKTQGRKNGVDAEMAARREGKQVLQDYFDNTCKKSDLDADWIDRLKPKSGWNGTALTSQGSEIFPEAVLLIKLTAPFSSVFSKYPPVKINPIKNAKGEVFVFQLASIPGHLLRCGTATLKLSSSRRLSVGPGFAGALADGVTVIKLNAGKDALEAATPADDEALKRSEVGSVRDGESPDASTPLLLPLVTK